MNFSIVGKYHSTTIWRFSFRCKECGYGIRVETDPENCDYKFTLGAKPIFVTSKASEGTIIDQRVQKQRKLNAFANMEGKVEDLKKKKEERPRLQKMIQLNDERWRDDYAANSLLRKRFREEKKLTDGRKYMHEGVKIEDLDEHDLRVARAAQFAKDSVLVRKRKMKAILMSRSIFGKTKSVRKKFNFFHILIFFLKNRKIW